MYCLVLLKIVSLPSGVGLLMTSYITSQVTTKHININRDSVDVDVFRIGRFAAGKVRPVIVRLRTV